MRSKVRTSWLNTNVGTVLLVGEDGKEYRVVISATNQGLLSLAQAALRNKTRRATDGPLTAKVERV